MVVNMYSNRNDMISCGDFPRHRLVMTDPIHFGNECSHIKRAGKLPACHDFYDLICWFSAYRCHIDSLNPNDLVNAWSLHLGCGPESTIVHCLMEIFNDIECILHGIEKLHIIALGDFPFPETFDFGDVKFELLNALGRIKPYLCNIKKQKDAYGNINVAQFSRLLKLWNLNRYCLMWPLKTESATVQSIIDMAAHAYSNIDVAIHCLKQNIKRLPFDDIIGETKVRDVAGIKRAHEGYGDVADQAGEESDGSEEIKYTLDIDDETIAKAQKAHKPIKLCLNCPTCNVTLSVQPHLTK